MKALLIFLLAFIFSLGGAAQNRVEDRCASKIDYEKLRKYNPYLYNYLLNIDRKAASHSQNNNSQLSPQSIPNTSIIVTIPVIVHVIHYGEAVGTGRNISDAQIQSQIDVLNEDYRRLNSDRTNTPTEFSGVAADVGIQFRLACTDPNGNPTTGIRRIQGNQANYTPQLNPDGTPNDAAIGLKVNDAPWDRDRYLNIWTASLNNGIGGYSTFPGAPANVDGVVIQYNAFGRTGTLQTNYNRGRTATHEIGHWLSLFHIWGTAGATNSTDCSDTDNVADTPNQAGSYLGQCPSGQQFSCGVSNMYQNYMDYTNDACMNLFTAGQRDRMKALFLSGNARAGFVSWSDISGNDRICAGSSYNYSVSSSGTSFNWTVSGSASIVSGQGTNQITISSIGNGPVTISVSSQGLCSSKMVYAGVPSSPTSLVVMMGPSGNQLCRNQTMGIAVGNTNNTTSQGVTQYVWNFGSWASDFDSYDNIPLSKARAYLHLTSGSASSQLISVYAQNSCGNGTAYSSTFYAINCGGFLMSYPNPAKDELTLSFDKTKAVKLPDQIDLINENSQKISYSFNADQINKTLSKGTIIQISVKDLVRGVYYLHLRRNDDKSTEKIRVILD